MAATAPATERDSAPPSGPAHVATVSFLAARAAPTGGFWIALAGGVALARVAETRGGRQGFGSSVAAMVETVAIMGPARFGVPLTQAVTAPLLGRLEARAVPAPLQVVACGMLRLLHNAAATAFFVWVVAGGLDAYAGTYDAVGRHLGIQVGTADALLLTAAGLLGWAAFASTVQVAVYRRGLRRWPEESPQPPDPPPRVRADAPGSRFDPRAVALAATLAFGILLASTRWPVLGAATAWLALAWMASRPDREPVPTGLVLAFVLASGAFAFALGGGLSLDVALRRAGRAALLVLVATWLRAAAGSRGLREVARRSLGRLGPLPAAPEAARVLDEIGSEGRLLEAGRSLLAAIGSARRRPLPVLDAVLAWAAGESRRFTAGAPPARLYLRPGSGDLALVVLAAAPALALAFG